MLFGAKFRLPVAIVVLCFSVFAFFGLDQLQIDTSLDSLIQNDDPQARIYEQVVKEFGSDDTTLVYVRDENLWSTEKLKALEELHYSFADLDYIRRVESLFTVSSVRASDDYVEAGPLLPYVPESAEELAWVRESALYSPLIRGNFISADGHSTVISVTLDKNPDDPKFDYRVYKDFERILAEQGGAFQQVFQIGSPRVRTELQESLFRDLGLIGPISAGVLIACIVVFLRNGFAALLPLFTSGLSILWCFGLMGWLGVPLNILSAMLPSLIIVMGSTEDTHILSSYLQGLEQEGRVSEADRARVRFKLTLSTMKHLGAPLVLTTLTTVIGLGTNMISDVGLIRDFGIAATLGMALNGLITLLCVPMILATIGPARFSESRRPIFSGVARVVLNFFNYLRESYGTLVLVVTLLFGIALAYAASQMHVSNDPLAYFKPQHALIQDAETVHEELSGMQVFYIHVEAPDDDAFRKPKHLRKLLEIENLMLRRGAFDRFISIADFVALVNQEWSQSERKQYRIPDDEGLIAQYLLFFHQNDISRYLSHDGRRANIVVRHNIRSSHRLNEELRELRREVQRILGDSAKFEFVGKNLMVNATAERLMSAQLQSLVLLLAVIFVMMSLLFTSWRGGVIAMIPNLLPIIFTFGLMALFGVPLNPGTATVAVIAIGVAIDDTIHLLTRYNEEVRKTRQPDHAIRTTLEAEAVPVISTSVSLFLGFSCLLASEFSIIAQFGALSAASMFFALVADLLITPILMSRIRLVSLWDILALRLDPAVIRNSELFTGMSAYQVRKAILLSEVRNFEPGQVIIRQGAIESEMFMLLEGTVEIFLRKKDRDIHLADVAPGAILGEVGFVKPIQRTAEVRAKTRVQMLVFEANRVRVGMRFYPRIAAKLNLNISAVLGSRLAENIQRVREYSDDRRRSPRFSLSRPVTATLADGRKVMGSVRNLSVDGGSLFLTGETRLEPGALLEFELGDLGALGARVIRHDNSEVVVRFTADDERKKDLLTWIRAIASEDLS